MDLWQRFADAWYDALLAFDREFRVVAVNARGAELFGIPAAALAGRRLRDVAPQAAAALEPVVGRAFLEGRAFAGDARPLETSDSFTLVANVLRGGEIVAMNVHRQSDATWPTDGVWLRRELDFAHRLLHAYSDNSSLAFVRWDENFRIVEWSPRAEAMFGWRFDEVCGRTWREIGLVHPDDAAEVDAQLEELIASANATVHVNRNLTRDGRALHCRWFNTAIRVDGAVHVVSLGDDVTDLFVTRATLTAQSDRLRELYLVAATSNAAAETQISATLDAGCRLLRMRCGAVYDVEGDVTVAAVGPPVPRRLVRLPLATEGALGLDDLRGLDDLVGADPGDGAPLSYIGTAIEAGGTRFGTLAFADAAPHAEAFSESDRDLVALMGALIGSAIERGRSRSRLNALAYTDPVTGLPNRAWFSERLHDELRAARAGERSVALMFLDLDRFKDINDTLGHALGDRLLRAIGERLRVVVGDEGLVARLGGDEFVVLAGGGPDVPQIDLLAQRIVRAIDQPVAVDGYEQFATTSVGIALFPADGDDADTLIKHADVAMYRAKERGRNTYQFYAPSMGTLVQNRIAQETLLRKGLERDEFVVHYQPQFDIEGTRLVALEALVRWQHPTLGLVQPDEFVPAAELSGLIVRLGDWVLETACRQIGAWQSLVPGLRVAVNLSGRQFHQNALDARIRILLSRSGLRPDQLELEITESVAMNDAALSVHLLEELGRAGVRLALDDFGTGYSSLGYLRRFPLDCIKIDKSFVRDVLIEPEDATIVRTVIAMAHSLGLEVCAEGVETEEQLAFLRAERCDRVQGFLFGQPMTAEETAVFLAGRGIRTAVG